jgi:hypothetical protein
LRRPARGRRGDFDQGDREEPDFLVVSQAVDPGLLQVLECDIVPRLENDVPNQPSSDQLEADPLLHRFTVVFDREERRLGCGDAV